MKKFNDFKRKYLPKMKEVSESKDEIKMGTLLYQIFCELEGYEERVILSVNSTHKDRVKKQIKEIEDVYDVGDFDGCEYGT